MGSAYSGELPMQVCGFEREEQFCGLSSPKGVQNLPVSASKFAGLGNAA